MIIVPPEETKRLYEKQVSAVASVGASAYGRGVHWTPAPLRAADVLRLLQC